MLTPNDPASGYFVAQVAALRGRLFDGGATLSAREIAYAFTPDQRERLRQEIAAAKTEAKEHSPAAVTPSSDANDYWRVALLAHRLTRAIGPFPSVGSPRATAWSKRNARAKKAQEAAREAWGRLDRKEQAYFEEPPEGGWPATEEVWAEMEWPLPILRLLTAKQPTPSDTVRFVQIAALDTLLAAMTKAEHRPGPDQVVPLARLARLQARLADK